MAVLTTTSQKRYAWIAWLDHCPGRNGRYVNLLFFGKTIGGVAEPWVDAFIALELALRATGYEPNSAWAFNFRGIGGAACTCNIYGNCSLHGQGTTIDIDPRDNPYLVKRELDWNDCRFTPTQIAAIEGIRNTKGEQMWFWGGRWTTIKDFMHFEPNVDPGSAQVDWTTVPGASDEEGDDVTLPLMAGDGYDSVPAEIVALFQTNDKPTVGEDRSRKIEDVRDLQDRLNKFGAGLTLDGRYGPATIVAAKQIGGSWTGHPDGKEGRWWGGNQNGELFWEMAKRAAENTGSTVDQEARNQAAAARGVADKALSGADLANASLNKIRSE